MRRDVYKRQRLVNPASGGNHYTCGDMLDLHNYPAPEMYLYDAQRANVLGEYGGCLLYTSLHDGFRRFDRHGRKHLHGQHREILLRVHSG